MIIISNVFGWGCQVVAGLVLSQTERERGGKRKRIVNNTWNIWFVDYLSLYNIVGHIIQCPMIIQIQHFRINGWHQKLLVWSQGIGQGSWFRSVKDGEWTDQVAEGLIEEGYWERERETEENVSGEMGRLTLRKSGREKVK